MRLTVHDVGHGLCISLIHDNGRVMLWDCGCSRESRPSVFLRELGVERIEDLFITNFNEDHFGDLPNLIDEFSIGSLWTNPSISPAQLEGLNAHDAPTSGAMVSLLDLMRSRRGRKFEPPSQLPGVRLSYFYNDFDGKYRNVNDLSLVTFVSCRGMTFIIPGALEKRGWLGLLEKERFAEELEGVNVFIASHQGRELGYCKNVFNKAGDGWFGLMNDQCLVEEFEQADVYAARSLSTASRKEGDWVFRKRAGCMPDVVIFSDSDNHCASQKMTRTYERHASGIHFDAETRSVLSTRREGSLTWVF